MILKHSYFFKSKCLSYSTVFATTLIFPLRFYIRFVYLLDFSGGFDAA